MVTRLSTVFLILCLGSASLAAQTELLTRLPAAPVPVALPPEQIAKFLTTQTVYPNLARRYAVEGHVVVEVLVDTTGRVKVLGLVRALFPSCDEAALRAVRRLPRITPFFHNGQPMERRMLLPFHFSLR